MDTVLECEDIDTRTEAIEVYAHTFLWSTVGHWHRYFLTSKVCQRQLVWYLLDIRYTETVSRVCHHRGIFLKPLFSFKDGGYYVVDEGVRFGGVKT